MKKRVITAVICLIILLPILWFSESVPFVFVISLFSALAVFEVACCFGMDPQDPYIWPFYAAALAAPFFVRYMPEGCLKVLMAICALLVLYGFSASTLSCGKVPFRTASSAMAFIIYIMAGLCSIVAIRDSVDYEGRFMFMLVFLGAWVTDAGAQLVGIALGRHKLIEKVSPHKTVEGAIGGVVCCVVGYIVYGLIVKGMYRVRVSFFGLVVLALFISCIDQLGDLIASTVKREGGIKDYGWIFPGHGGAVDRLDSIVSNALFIAVYMAFGLPAIF